MILRTWGIEDASDVEESKIEAIKGFGPAKVANLMSWREGHESSFRFNQNEPVDPRDIQAIEQENAQKTQNLQSSLRVGPQKLQQILGIWQAQRRQGAARLHGSASVLAQAKKNYRALKGVASELLTFTKLDCRTSR